MYVFAFRPFIEIECFNSTLLGRGIAQLRANASIKVGGIYNQFLIELTTNERIKCIHAGWTVNHISFGLSTTKIFVFDFRFFNTLMSTNTNEQKDFSHLMAFVRWIKKNVFL